MQVANCRRVRYFPAQSGPFTSSVSPQVVEEADWAKEQSPNNIVTKEARLAGFDRLWGCVQVIPWQSRLFVHHFPPCAST